MVSKICKFFGRLQHVLCCAAFSLVFLSAAISEAENVYPASAPTDRQITTLPVPREYGQVIYQINGHLPQQIYIVGQTHRSPLTGMDNPEIVRVQAEIYRIGEWLIREQKVGMLLPEGFFKETAGKISAPAEVAREIVVLDNQSLAARLGDTHRFVNADLLLNSSYNISLGQVENERLYRNIYQLLLEASRESNLSALSRLGGLQIERTALMLQNIPDIVEEAYAAGMIENRKAMFTIGLAHVGEIINFLQHGSFRLPANSDLREEQIMEARLKLLDRGYGVTVILPRALIENERILALARLDVE